MLVSKLSFVSMITKFQTYTVHVPGKLIIMMFYLSKKVFIILQKHVIAAEGIYCPKFYDLPL